MRLFERKPPTLVELTILERQILQKGAGWTNEELAIELGTSVHNIKKNITSLNEKLKTRNKAHAAARAVNLGLICATVYFQNTK